MITGYKTMISLNSVVNMMEKRPFFESEEGQDELREWKDPQKKE